MAKDFKAKQLRAHKLIASGSDVSGGVPSLLIYSASSATNQSGGIPTAGAGALLANVGSDVFLFVSGAKGDGSALSRKDATLFGGDVVVSGTLFMEKIVAEVDGVTKSDHYVSGSLIVENGGSSDQPIVKTFHGSTESNIDVAVALSNDAGGEGAIAFDWSKTEASADALIYEANGVLHQSASHAFNFGGPSGETRQGSGVQRRKDTYFFVSGTKDGIDDHSKGFISVFGGDLVVSGNLHTHNGKFRIYNSPAPEGSPIPNDYFSILVNSSNGETTLSTNDADAGTDGHLNIEADGRIILDVASGKTVRVAEDGDQFLEFKMASGMDAIITHPENGKDIILQQYDGNELLRGTDDNKVLILSGGAAGSHNVAARPDVNFFVSGAIGSKDTSTIGTSVFGGDVVISGTLHTTFGTIEATGLQVSGDSAITGTLFVAQDITHASDDNTKITFTPDNFAVKVGGVTAIDLSNVAGAGRNDKIFIGGKGASDRMNRVLILSGGAPVSPDQASGDDVVFYVSGAVGTHGHEGGSAALFGGDLVTSGNLVTAGNFTVSSPGVGKDVRFYGEDSSAQGFHWDADFAEHGALILGANDHGVDLFVFGETSGRMIQWDQGTDKLSVYGSFEQDLGDVTFNKLQGSHDFTVGSNTRTAIKVDGDQDMVVILSQSNSLAPDATSFRDINFYVSGVINTAGNSTVRGSSLFAGDLITSGNFHVIEGRQIQMRGPGTGPQEHFQLKKFGPTGSPFMPGMKDIAIIQNMSGSVMIGMGTGSLTGSNFKFAVTEMGMSNNTTFMEINSKNGGQVLFMSGGSALSPDVTRTSTDIVFFVSGNMGGRNKLLGATSVFGGDLVVSGAVSGGEGVLRLGEYKTDLGSDVSVFISGSKGSANTTTKGTALFGGDVYVSGALYADDFTVTDDLVIGDDLTVSGDLDVTGTTTLGTNIFVPFKIMHEGDTDTALQFTNNEIRLKAANRDQIVSFGSVAGKQHDHVLILSGGSANSPNYSAGGDVAFYVSGTIGSVDTQTNGTAVFGGDLAVSGSVQIGKGSGGNLTIHGDSTLEPALSLASTFGGSSGPIQLFSLQSASPADDDTLGEIFFSGKDSAGNANTHYASIKVQSSDVTDSDEGGKITFNVLRDGANKNILSLGGYDKANDTSAEVVVNEDGSFVDFRVESQTNSHALFVDSTNNKILFLSGGNASSSDSASGADINFYVSGAVGSKNSLVKGTALFGGDLVVSGGLAVDGSTLYVNQANNRVGIGTTSPQRNLHIHQGNSALHYGLTIRNNQSGEGLQMGNNADGSSFINNNESNKGGLHLGGAGSAYNNGHIFISGSGKVGIGTASPDTLFHIKSTSPSQPVVKIENQQGGSNPVSIQMLRNTSSPADDDFIGQIDFRSMNDAGTPEETLYAYITALSTDITDGTEDGEIQFHTMKAGTLTNTLTLQSGKAGIGTNTPGGNVHVKSGESGATPSALADELVVEGAVSTGISILTPNNQVGRLYFGDSDNNARAYVLYDHSIDTMKFSVASGNRMIINSDGNIGVGTESPTKKLEVNGSFKAASLSGSLTQLGDGTSYLIAGTNVTIASASNGAITISSSGGGGGGGGSVTVVSGSTSLASTTEIDFTEAGILNSNGSGKIALTGTLGNPSDGAWSDGLFSSFGASTTIGTAIDRINEVLKFLAPSPAPSADNINAKGSQGATALVSFGPDRPGDIPSGYTAVSSVGTLSAANVNSSYAPSTGSGGDLRLGIYNAAFNVEGVINSDVVQTDYNAGAIVNYSGSSFGDADQGTLALHVNGSAVKTIDLTDPTVGAGNPLTGSASLLGTGDHSNSGFISFSATGSSTTQAGVAFDIFKYRTGQFRVGTASMRKGWNYAQVIHTIGSNATTTNFVAWLYDADGNDSSSAIDTEASTIVANTLDGGTNRYDLSGVRYAVSSSGEYRTRVTKFYENVYAANSITLTPSNASIGSTTPSTVPILAVGETASKKLNVTGTWATSATSLLGSTIGTTITLPHPTKTGLTNGGSATSGKVLIFSASNYSSNLVEHFDHEGFRIVSGNYDNQPAGSHVWNSTTKMEAGNTGFEDGLQFYNSRLKSPLNTINSGDFRSTGDGGSFFGAGLIYDSQPNYSGISGVRTFYRKIQNTTGGPISDFKIISAGSGLTIVPGSTALNNSRVRIFARLPGEPGSGWLDLGSTFSYHNTANYAGGRANDSLDATIDGGGATNYFTFGTGSVANNEFFVIKIEADASITGHIETLTFATPGIQGTTVRAPNVSTLNSTQGGGVDAKLSFGSSKAITGYTPVTSATGFLGAVDINQEYTVTSTRYGVFDKTTNIVGEINHNVTSNGNNYVADAFGGGNAHTGTLKLEINGAVHHTLDLNGFNSGDSKTGNSGFTSLSAAVAAKGTSGIVRDYTKFYRTGDFIVHTDQQRVGGNFARVIHTVTGTDFVTNFVEWVNDDDSDEIALNDAVFGEFGDNGFYHQSGVKYFISPTGSFMVRASDAYSAVYSGLSDAIAVSSQTNLNTPNFIQVTGSGITNAHASSNQMSLPALDTSVTDPHTLDIFATASVAFSRSESLPGSSPFSVSSYAALAVWRFKHPLDSTSPVSTSNIYVGGGSNKKFLVFSGTVAGTTNVHTREDFGREDFRVVSGNYTTQNSLSAGTWDSTKSINQASNGLYFDGLLVYAGLLVSPKNSGLEGNGDFRSVFEVGSSNIISPANNVNYSTLPTHSSSHRTYIRRFANNTVNNVFNVDVTLYGSANIVGRSGALSGSLGSNTNIYVEGKIPGKTGWLDLGKATAGSGNTSDGDGGLNGDIDHTVDGSGAANNLTFNGQTVEGTGTGPDQLLIKITAHKNWTGNLSRIDISY